jgi:phage gp29-like protein
MTNTDSLKTFAKAVQSKIEDNKGALEIQDVYFGDQNKIPRVPAACVEPVDKTRELDGAPRRTKNDIQVYVFVYHARIGDVQDTLEEALDRSEAVEALLHADSTLGGLVIHSLVTALEQGLLRRSGTFYRGTRLTFTGLTKTNLPYSAI